MKNLLTRITNWIRRVSSQGYIWPPIDAELSDLRDRGLFRGKILNAGAGWRDLSNLIDGDLVNQDIKYPDDNRTNIQIFAPIQHIPCKDSSFDGVLCIAVLEHVENPDQCVREFFRIIKADGWVVASIPFLQPEHKIPTDYQRYTKDGICWLFESNGFLVEEVTSLYTVYHTIHWIVYEWLHLKNSFFYKLLRVFLIIPLAIIAKRSTLQSDKLATGFRVVARKPSH